MIASLTRSRLSILGTAGLLLLADAFGSSSAIAQKNTRAATGYGSSGGIAPPTRYVQYPSGTPGQRQYGTSTPIRSGRYGWSGGRPRYGTGIYGGSEVPGQYGYGSVVPGNRSGVTGGVRIRIGGGIGYPYGYGYGIPYGYGPVGPYGYGVGPGFVNPYGYGGYGYGPGYGYGVGPVTAPFPATTNPQIQWPPVQANPTPQPVPQPDAVDPGPGVQEKAAAFERQGDYWFTQQEYSRAYSRYASAIRTADTRPLVHFKQGFALVAMGSFDRAVKQFREAIALDPKYPEHPLDLLELLGPENQLARGVILDRLLTWAKEDIRNPNRLFLLGVVLHKERPTEARTMFEGAWRMAGRGDHILAFLGKAPERNNPVADPVPGTDGDPLPRPLPNPNGNAPGQFPPLPAPADPVPDSDASPPGSLPPRPRVESAPTPAPKTTPQPSSDLPLNSGPATPTGPILQPPQ